MSREAERSIREREAPAKQSGKKQISSGLTEQLIIVFYSCAPILAHHTSTVGN